MSKGKLMDREKFMIGALILLGLVIAGYAGWLTPIGSAISGFFSVEGKPNPVITQGCSVSGAPSMTIKTAEFYTSTSVNIAYKYREQGSSAWTTGTTGTAVTDMTIGKTYEVVIGVDNASYYSVKDFITVPCEANPSKEVKIKAIATNSSLSVYVKNNDGQANSNSVPQSLNAGDIKDVTITLAGQYQKDWGNTKLLLSCNGTNSVLDSLKLNGFTEVDEPGNMTKASDFSYYSWIINDNLKSNSNELSFKLTIDADDTNAPGTEDIDCEVWDENGYINADTQNYETGFEDEDDTIVGANNKLRFTIHTS